MDFINKALEWIKGHFHNFDGWLKNTVNFDQRFLDFYQGVISPLAEWIKIVGLLAIAFLLVLGIFSFIKKLYKLFIVLIIIGVIIGLVVYFV